MRLADFADRGHAVEDEISASNGALGVLDRRVARAANESGEKRSFGERQLADGLAEIILGGGLETVIAVREIDLIAVHREDLLLGVVALDLDREERLLDLAAHADVGAIREKRAGELHGERARAFGTAVRARQVAPGGAEHAREVHAPVLLEMLVFGGEDGVLQNRRNLVVGQKNAALQGERADQLAVVGVEFGDDVRLVVFEGVDLRQIAGIDEEESGYSAHGNRGNQQEDEGQPASEFTATQMQSDRRKRIHRGPILTRPGDALGRTFLSAGSKWSPHPSLWGLQVGPAPDCGGASVQRQR